MSYCVNCGVELDASLKRCPLCDTVVINPSIIGDTEAQPPFPDEQQLLDATHRKRWLAGLISIVLAIPASVCILCNYGIQDKLSWSLIVAAALVMIWAFSVPMLLMKKVNFIPIAVIDTAAILLFLFVLNLQVQDPARKNWFTTIALPLVLCIMAFVCINAVLIKNDISRLYVAAVLFLTIGALVVAIEIITDIYLSDSVSLSWSLIALVPCALLSLLYVFIQKRKRLKESMKKRFHI